MEGIDVIVHGALGKMGQTVINAVSLEPGMRVVAGADTRCASVALPGSGASVPVYDSIARAVEAHPARVVVDFSLADGFLGLARYILPRGICLVSGTTGMDSDSLEEVKTLSAKHRTGVIVASNFAIGSVLMMHLAQIASGYFDNAEIIELHHDKKADAPSGTALATARGMQENRDRPFSNPDKTPGMTSRGLASGGMHIHSIRLPGILARQEVLFGAPGQTLSITHDAISRECYMPGVIMALHRVVNLKEMVFGLDKLMGL
ncbi:MAG: 4-hydroxy-tetrahydrodipicolinate reductase [Dehalococcoidaceae bacterium]|nr:4-hydroxy-tetrahydrodipicolinate reductase [Dehalococcoidaceae bacterium]